MINKTIFLLVVLFATSCVSRKNITYFQPKDTNSAYDIFKRSKGVDIETKVIKERNATKIQAGDVLNIRVFSLSPEANQMFNVFPETQTQSSLNQSTASTELVTPVGFLVDSAGTVTLPLAGKIKIGGMGTKEASDSISKKLEQFLMQPTVNVRIVNFKISVLGEVQKPSVYLIDNERVTLPEALALAGDLTIYGRRKNVLVIRELNGKREFARVDLTQRDFFDSPYFYLKPNDIVYVEPSRGKVISSGGAVTLLPIIISSLTLFVLAYYYTNIVSRK